MSDAAEAGDPGAAVASNEVRREVSSWAGVSVTPGPMSGSLEFRFRHRVLGHLHAVWGAMAMVDLMFPPEVGEALIAAGRAEPHPMIPALGWVTVPLRSSSDGTKAIALFRENYDRIGAQLRLL